MIEAETMEGAGEGKVGGSGSIRLDPFLQPPILKAFFEVLSVEDLAKCRLVCKLWKKESLSTWRSKATLNFREEGLVSTRKDGSTRITSLEDFCDLWDAGDWGSCPFRKSKLHRWNFVAEDVQQERFLELMGCHLTTLTIDRCTFVERGHYQRIIYQVFPQLQVLKMYWDGVDHPDRDQTEEILAYQEPTFGVHELSSLEIGGDHRPLMMEMLSHFHKIKSLILDLDGVHLDYRNLLEVIRLIREQDQTKLRLKNFDVYLSRSNRRIASWIERIKLHEQLDLPLQRLSIYIHPVEDADCNFNDAIRAILQNHSSTLKSLEFAGGEEDRHGLCNSFPFGFCLENLEYLTIRSPFFMHNLNYLRYTPKLRVLVLEESSLRTAGSDSLFSNSTQLEMEDWTLPTLTDLTFYPTLSVCNLRKLMKWMPNVRRLYGFKLEDITFSMVCENWKNLTCLMDFGQELTDAGVIGISHGHEAGGDAEICPNITKLKNLMLFCSRSSKLTSASVHDGFLKLANLGLLSLGRDSKIDDEARAALEKRIPGKYYIDVDTSADVDFSGPPHTTSRDYMYYIKFSFIPLLAVFFWFNLN